MNSNIENELRHKISDKMLRDVKEISYSQDEFGINKYGEPLRHTYDYDWLKMIREELVDAEKYLQCEMERKRDVIMLLKSASHQETVEDLKAYIETILEILTVEGTGK